VIRSSFNSLYWDFLSESKRCFLAYRPSSWTFNSLYWDFLSESTFWIFQHSGCSPSFNSLYWDFLSESRRFKKGGNEKHCLFQFPLLGFSFWIKQ